MHAQGVSLSDLGVGQAEFSEEQSRNAFRLLCKHWPIYRGTSVKFWFESTFVDVFGIDVRPPSEETADQIYDQIAEKLASPEYTPPRACSIASGSSSSRPPTIRWTISPPMRRSPPTRPSRSGSRPPSGPTSTSNRPARTGSS